MNLDAAKRAGELAASIETRLAKIAEIDVCLEEGWRINEAWARTDNNRACNLVLSALDPETNAQALAFIKGVYQAQLEALESELATLGA